MKGWWIIATPGEPVIVRGWQRPTREEFEKIAESIGCSVDDLRWKRMR